MNTISGARIGAPTMKARDNNSPSPRTLQAAREQTLLQGIPIVSEGIPVLGKTSEDHEVVVRKMRLRICWLLRSHTHDDNVVITEDAINQALQLMEILGVDVLSQEEAILHLAGPTFSSWNGSFVSGH